MRRVLVAVALILAFVAAVLAFEFVANDKDTHALGWLAASLVAYFGSLLDKT